MTTATLPRVALRPLAVPNEHGGWGFLLEPVVLALAVAPSGAGVAIAAALLAAFFMRHPLRLAARDLMLGKRYPRTSVCASLALAYGAAALVCLIVAVASSSMLTLAPLLMAVPFLGVQMHFDMRNRGREWPAEICGAVGAAAGGAACVLAAGAGFTVAFTIAAIAMSRSVPSVLYVRSLLRRSTPAPGLLAHALAVALVAALPGLPLVATLIPIVLLGRSVAGRSVRV
jgi:hypothetical protein